MPNSNLYVELTSKISFHTLLIIFRQLKVGKLLYDRRHRGLIG